MTVSPAGAATDQQRVPESRTGFRAPRQHGRARPRRPRSARPCCPGPAPGGEPLAGDDQRVSPARRAPRRAPPRLDLRELHAHQSKARARSQRQAGSATPSGTNWRSIPTAGPGRPTCSSPRGRRAPPCTASPRRPPHGGKFEPANDGLVHGVARRVVAALVLDQEGTRRRPATRATGTSRSHLSSSRMCGGAGGARPSRDAGLAVQRRSRPAEAAAVRWVAADRRSGSCKRRQGSWGWRRGGVAALLGVLVRSFSRRYPGFGTPG
ncbi:hypothetical protein SMICM17S_12719 [Streptomyces microflavus]